MNTPLRTAALGIALTSSLVLTACGGSSETIGSSSTTSNSIKSGTSTGSSTQASHNSDGTTPPGSQLRFGTAGTFERTTIDKGKYRSTITVQQPEQGSDDDLAKIREIEDFNYPSGATAYFVRYTVRYDAVDAAAAKNLGDEIVVPERLSLDSIDQTGYDSSASGKVGFGGKSYAFDKCAMAKLPETVQNGTTASSCLVFVLFPGKKLTKVRYDDQDKSPYSSEGGKPVFWS